MKRFTWLILLIGMISFTGLSSTVDLPTNSDIAYTIDVDVGVDNAMVVDNFQFKSIMHSEIIVFRQYAIVVENNFPEIMNRYINDYKRKGEPPSNYNLRKAKSYTKSLRAIFRSPRDRLIC